MKAILISVITAGTFFFTSCANKNNGKEHEGHDMSKMKNDTMQNAAAPDDKDIKTVAVTYGHIDAKAASVINGIVEHYLHIKNALANDNASEAANGSKAMTDAMGKLDKSLFTAEQKKVYDDIEAVLKEHAEHIGKHGDDIKHQRSHFVSMSEDIYDLVKAFGAGRPLYHDHCPMARDNQGAMWISEVKEIKNPYFGAEMYKCGRVEEVIK